MGNALAVRNNLGQMIYAPSFLIIASAARNVIALHHQSIESSENYHYLVQSFPTLFMCVSTWLIWQCYFANSVASTQAFCNQWRVITSWQRFWFCAVGLPLLLMAFVVGVGLLQVTDGPSPSPLLQVGILTPAALWVIPVVLSATITVFGANVNAAVEQMKERALTHVVHLLLYFVFLHSSHLDTLLGAGSIGVCAMFGVTFLGFVLQVLWRVYPYMAGMYMVPHRQPTCVPESEEQNRSYSEIVLFVAMAIHRDSAGHELALSTSNLPKLPNKAEMVIQTDTLVSSRHVPNDVHRPEASHSQHCVPVVTSYKRNVLATPSD